MRFFREGQHVFLSKELNVFLSEELNGFPSKKRRYWSIFLDTKINLSMFVVYHPLIYGQAGIVRQYSERDRPNGR